MKLKLTYAQFTSLYELFQKIVLSDTDLKSVEDKLVHVLMLRIYQKLYKKAIERRAIYNIKLEPEEAMAFLIYWQAFPISHSSFEGNLLTQTLAKIDQQFA